MTDPIKWNGATISSKIGRAAMRGVAIGISMVEQRAVSLVLGTTKSGAVYRRRGVTHQASAPGEPFASDTGSTINHRRIEFDDGSLSARLIFDTPVAAYLEFGTRKMEPRPFARRALAETRTMVEVAIQAEIRAAMI